MNLIEMRSRGMQYSPLIKSTAMLGLRATRAQLMNFSIVIAQIESTMSIQLAAIKKENAPSLRSAELWDKDNPLYPEEALRMGLFSENDLPLWARNQLNKEAQMSQTSYSPGNRIAPRRRSRSSRVSTRSFGNRIVLAVLLVGGLFLYTRSRSNRPNLEASSSSVPISLTMRTVNRRPQMY